MLVALRMDLTLYDTSMPRCLHCSAEKRRPGREGSARALLEVLPDGARAVVLGDLNATPDSAAYATLSAALRDLWGEARPGVSGETVPAEAPTRRIDYVFASATFGPVRDAVLLDERDGDTWLSDHLGVAVAVAWGP